MGTKLNKDYYQKLIDEDIKVLLKSMPDTLERKHIIDVLNDSVNYYYPECKKSTKNSPIFPMFEEGTKVRWTGSDIDLLVIEDNGEYNMLIGTHMDSNHRDYNDWWVDKRFIKQELPKQICYKTNEECKHNCQGLCKESC